MHSRWIRGVWLGKTHTTDEHVVWTTSGAGICTGRSVQVRDEDPTLDMLRGVTDRPHCKRSTKEGVRLHGDVVHGDVHVPSPDRVGHDGSADDWWPSKTRQWQITKEVFTRCGATPNCGKCTDWSHNKRTARGHTRECRRRLEDLLRHDPIWATHLSQREQERRRTRSGSRATRSSSEAV